ncbi:5-formyltetrahydrofolate cyclo-ligase [Paenisporosarcina sp. TG20]|uniref:5-formyltetrahydrofolate cyclo-ligase n=1 Tax=Paenisporosarcina sp. TG20 TaxID=1211706 RepID=UPI0002F743CB|nr:5-formyltetrahydrofolate cyclo-ligase [Paenisporosarcina sp. TG20]
MEKSILRKMTLQVLNEMELLEHQQKSQKIQKRLIKEDDIKNAQIIGITLSSLPEVDTWNLIEELWNQGKQVAVPKCNPISREMNFYVIDSYNQLEVVYMKLKEPIPNMTKSVNENQIDVLIVPGVVFDRRGYRIGFGGGYYDRFLSGYGGPTVALAFNSQMIEKVPVERFDLPVNIILTESERIQCSNTE